MEPLPAAPLPTRAAPLPTPAAPLPTRAAVPYPSRQQPNEAEDADLDRHSELTTPNSTPTPDPERPAANESHRARLEDLTPGARIRGLIPRDVAEVVQVKWHGTMALTLTYRDQAGRVAEQILYRETLGRE